ncbi:hypothetical protein [Fluviicola sp.]|uniref:hypothetical protein n=1 Tax=Fluviicola sp. TaxID=1917219 RepID=UPI0031DE4C6E
MKVRAFIKDDLEGSFVYLIFSKDVLYIGETQRIAISRWVQHIYQKSNFYKKIQLLGLDFDEYSENVHFVSVELTEIRESFPENRWRVITQAVEHALHERLYLSRSELLEAYYKKYYDDIDYYRIISDTTRTAPAKIMDSDWQFARGYAKQVLDDVYSFI